MGLGFLFRDAAGKMAAGQELIMITGLRLSRNRTDLEPCLRSSAGTTPAWPVGCAGFFEKISKTDQYGRWADKPGLPPNAALVTRGQAGL